MSTATTTIASIPQGNWAIDPSHSSVEFTVKHMGIATVRGQATKFEGTIQSSDDQAGLNGSVDVASITTHDEQRDEHLGAPDFFDVERYPQIAFRSDSIEVAEDGSVRIPGEITLKGVTKPIELTGSYQGAGTDPWGNERFGLEVSATIDRRDFGLNWNQPLPGGGLLVSNDVTLLLSASAVKGE
ncbi:MAG TPA: YceI family protein [Thermoleophilaceae bacterium]|jgi:polyisoprenoid-binding protein YceI